MKTRKPTPTAPTAPTTPPAMTYCPDCGRAVYADLDPNGCNYCKEAHRQAKAIGTVYQPRG